jgi:hypothetical protein
VNTSIVSQIQALQRMTVGQLRVEWERLHGEPTRSRNRTYLWRRLAWRIQELQFGGLSEASKLHLLNSAPTTFERSQVPAGLLPAHGGISASPRHSPRRDPRLPAPGSTIVRKYKGDDIRVLVLDNGFEWSSRHFDSLSEVALAITGSKWNGWLFFGLTSRKRAR